MLAGSFVLCRETEIFPFSVSSRHAYSCIIIYRSQRLELLLREGHHYSIRSTNSEGFAVGITMIMNPSNSPSLFPMQMESDAPRRRTSINIDPTKLVAKPLKPLTGYNIFFKLERERILNETDHMKLPVTDEDLVRIRRFHQANPKRSHKKSHGKISFQELNRRIAKRWRETPEEDRAIFHRHSDLEKSQYDEQLRKWQKQEEATQDSDQFVVQIDHLPGRIASISSASTDALMSRQVTQFELDSTSPQPVLSSTQEKQEGEDLSPNSVPSMDQQGTGATGGDESHKLLNSFHPREDLYQCMDAQTMDSIFD